MATSRKLLSIVGKPVKSAAFRALVAADRLKASKEPDMEEGQPEAWFFVGKRTTSAGA
jgi:hypothetical protein